MEIRRLFTAIWLFLAVLAVQGQSATQILDKVAAKAAHKDGVTADFTIKAAQTATSGSIAVKGKKLHATTPQAVVWFDGKTQWTYMKNNDEVNVANPTEAQLAAINPYNFIYLYKKGYTSTMAKKGSNYEIHLKATDKTKAIQEFYIVARQKTYVLSQIRMKQKQGWVTIDIRNFKTAKLADALFRFNSKDFPTAEVIDLR